MLAVPPRALTGKKPSAPAIPRRRGLREEDKPLRQARPGREVGWGSRARETGAREPTTERVRVRQTDTERGGGGNPAFQSKRVLRKISLMASKTFRRLVFVYTHRRWIVE